MIKLLKYPHPYKAWLTISNDPDNTTIEAWHELNDFIFNELKLDWANTIFPYSYNLNLPDQVNLDKHPEIAKQPTDALHTWGDFVHAGQRGFSRADAEAGTELLKKNNIQPRIWVDHSRFTGNLLHNNSWGAVPTHDDSSGNTYTVFEYTLDLVKQLGISYVWDGKLTQSIGQDRRLELKDYLIHYSFLGKIRFLFLNGYRFFVPGFKRTKGNAQYKKHTFPDGNVLYVFKRFGNWRDADILGLSNVISKNNINTLIQKGGTLVAYTHLGKESPKYHGESHIPPQTKACLHYVKQRVEASELIFTPLSKMLDYLVLRDNMSIKGNEIHFKPDGIRFKQLTCEDLLGHTFSLQGITDVDQLIVYVNNLSTKAKWQVQNSGIVDFSF